VYQSVNHKEIRVITVVTDNFLAKEKEKRRRGKETDRTRTARMGDRY
jgi:hypothetical protein